MDTGAHRGGAAALLVALIALASGCDRHIYVTDGVTDGTRFYVLPQQLADEGPVNQSWISYSLARSACQLRLGGDNPARDTAFECEVAAREALIASWLAYRAVPASAVAADDRDAGAYLDTLTQVRDAGFLREYVWHYLRERHWSRPENLGLESFTAWRQLVLDGHRATTRLVGAWI